MKTKYKINILVITALLCLAQVFTFAQQADIILSEPLTKNIDLSASNSIILAPGFHTNGYTFSADIVLHTIFTETYMAPILSNKNCVHTKTYTYANNGGVEQPAKIGDILHDIQYFDGLGRLSQTVGYKASPQGNDIVKYYKYDEYGRPSQDFLPFTYPNAALSTISGHEQGGYIDASYITGAGNFLDVYYNQGNNGSGIPNADGEYYFAETMYDNSPLNRVMEQGAPGSTWAVEKDASGNSTGVGHTVKYDYLTNTSSTEVKKFSVNSSGTVVDDGYYGINQLTVTVTKSENWHHLYSYNNGTVHEYKDKQGRVVLKRSYEYGAAHDTYYVYDDFGLLRCVIPPKAEGAVINELCYFYKYDERKRMIEKNLPGAEAVYMVYDKRDRLALTQDGNQRTVGKWLIHKYDALNRPVMTAEKEINYSFEELRTAFDTHTYTAFETRTSSGNIGYTVTNHPYSANITISEADLLTIVYYDDYSFPGFYSFNDAVNISGYSDTNGDTRYFDNVKGLTTGGKTKLISGPTQGEWLINTIYYDDRYRPIQTSQTKFYSTFSDGTIEHTCIERTSSKYDFTGKAEQTRVTQWIGGQTTTIDKLFTYDHAGRLSKTEQEIEGDANGRVVLSYNIYNELGEVITKKLHSEDGGSSYAQNIDYQYNTRGWLESINDPDNIGGDLFAMDLVYDDVTDLGSMNKESQYNGNISGLIWNTHKKQSDGTVYSQKAAYSYFYDDLNRLRGNYYSEGETLTPSDKYRESGLTYDKNGNITALYRTNNLGVTVDSLEYLYYDDNTSNKLLAVTELASTSEGLMNAFRFGYDSNGNFEVGIKDNHIYDITYNYLNLPSVINLSSEEITTYAYDASGIKTMKVHEDVINNETDTRYYAGGIEYDNSLDVSLIHMDEGVVNYASGGYTYEYHLKDHLGNVRLVFTPTSTGNNILQSNDYYAFGLRHIPVTPENDNKYLYNGKEIQEGTDWYDYGFRMYDPALGRFHTLDLMAESNITQSPYVYAANNPVNLIDVLGLDDDDPDDDEEKSDEQKLIEYYQNLGYNVNNIDDVSTVVNAQEGMTEDFVGYVSGMITEGGFESFQNLYDMMPKDFFFDMAQTFDVPASGWLGELIEGGGMVNDAFHISEWTHSTIADGTPEMNQLEHFIGSFLMTAKYGNQGAHMMTTANEIRGLIINDEQSGNVGNALRGRGGTAFEWSDLRNNKEGRKLYNQYARMKYNQLPFKEKLNQFIKTMSTY